jgi:hypothetical protein
VSKVVDLTEISAVVAAAGVLIGVAYYILDMRNQTKMRKTELFMRIWEFGSTDEFMGALEKVNNLQFKDYKDFVAKYGGFLSEDPTARALWRVYSFFSLLGTLVDKKLLDMNFVYHFASPQHTTMLYERLKPITLGLRKDFNEPYLMQDFEYLINEFARNLPQAMEEWKKREQQFTSKTA